MSCYTLPLWSVPQNLFVLEYKVVLLETESPKDEKVYEPRIVDNDYKMVAFQYW
jgi:hypothetical protein